MKLHIVIYEPAIIQNVGNIARTCYAFNAQLHLIRPYGFLFNKSKLKKSINKSFWSYWIKSIWQLRRFWK